MRTSVLRLQAKMNLFDEQRTCANCGNTFGGYGNVCPQCGHTVPHTSVELPPPEYVEESRRRGFTDLHSFKDYVVYVAACAPDLFPEQDPAPRDTLESAFEGLHYGLMLSESQGANSAVIAKCRELMQTALHHYRAGREREGMLAMEEMSKTIKRLPSH
jgi:hypothetical protein